MTKTIYTLHRVQYFIVMDLQKKHGCIADYLQNANWKSNFPLDIRQHGTDKEECGPPMLNTQRPNYPCRWSSQMNNKPNSPVYCSWLLWRQVAPGDGRLYRPLFRWFITTAIACLCLCYYALLTWKWNGQAARLWPSSGSPAGVTVEAAVTHDSR